MVSGWLSSISTVSSTLNIYLVDLAELVAVVGSEDNERLDRILAWEPDALLLGFDADDRDDHVERNKDALRKIFAGGPFVDDDAEHYVEALELICEELGGPPFSGARFRFGSGDLPSIIEELASGMMEEDPFPDAPDLAESIEIAEGNGWGHMSKEDCAEELDHWERAVAEDPDYCAPFGPRIVEWLRRSKEVEKDLIGFWG